MEAQMDQVTTTNNNRVNESTSEKNPNKAFITANSEEVTLQHLQNDCIIPVFSKDNESTISHQEFIEALYEVANQVFPMEKISEPEIRVSHVIKGRTPEAVGKPAKDLLENEKTIYYERVGFLFEVSSVTNTINGNTLKLSIGGVRAYNLENLYGKKTMERFKVFIGFKNTVCCNLCVSSDGYVEELRVSNPIELMSKVFELFQRYNAQKHLSELNSFCDYELTQHQFCQFLGKSRLYNYLPKSEKVGIPYLGLNDGQVNAIAKAYYEDINFAANENGSINLWKVYNLLTGALKSNYIDNFLDRTVNAHQLAKGLIHALDGDSAYTWFLS